MFPKFWNVFLITLRRSVDLALARTAGSGQIVARESKIPRSRSRIMNQGRSGSSADRHQSPQPQILSSSHSESIEMLIYLVCNASWNNSVARPIIHLNHRMIALSREAASIGTQAVVACHYGFVNCSFRCVEVEKGRRIFFS